MKIALVAEQSSQLTPARAAAPADAGGQAFGLTSLAGSLAGLGHDVTVYARRDSSSQPARAAIAPGAVRTDSSQDFAAFFQASDAGGVFLLRALFPVTGNASGIASFDVALTNSAGTAKTSLTLF